MAAVERIKTFHIDADSCEPKGRAHAAQSEEIHEIGVAGDERPGYADESGDRQKDQQKQECGDGARPGDHGSASPRSQAARRARCSGVACGASTMLTCCSSRAPSLRWI